MKNFIVIVLAGIFFFVGYTVLQDSLPQSKEKRIYEELKQYMPYTLEKRIGGFSIIDKRSDEKTKPPSSEVFKELDRLEAEWGREHLQIRDNDLLVRDSSKKVIATIKIESEKEMMFLRSFFGIIPD